MRFLLDVSALIAFGIGDHEFHRRVATWIGALSPKALQLVTCAITELGFVRVVSQTSRYGMSTPEARIWLMKLKARHAEAFAFIRDDQDVSQLPAWVQHPKQVTDGHLVQLARANHALLATLDRGIPGAYLIP